LLKLKLGLESETAGATPVPESVTVCGLPLALSVTVNDALTGPRDEGVNVTLIGQLAPAARPVPQLFVCEKLLCVVAMLEMVRGAVPVLLRVTCWVELGVPTFWLPKLRLVCEKLTMGATPVPVSETLSGLSLALSVTVSDAVTVPGDEGVNVTLMAQLAPAARAVPQLFVCEKLPTVVAMLEMVSAALPVLLRVTCWAELAVPTFWFPKLRLGCEKLTMGPKPVPVSETLCGLPLALSVTVSDALTVTGDEGVNVTLIVQPVPAARVVPQLFVCEKLLTVVAILEMVSMPVPVLLRVTCWEELAVPTFWFPKLRLGCEKLTMGTSPVPLRFTVCGLLTAVSVSVSAPLRAPLAVGEKLTLIVQLPLAGTEGRQLLLCVQSLEIDKLLMLSASEPVFVTVTA
jgi:hypothetical protein